VSSFTADAGPGIRQFIGGCAAGKAKASAHAALLRFKQDCQSSRFASGKESANSLAAAQQAKQSHPLMQHCSASSRSVFLPG
jgi:hypothetical protein